VSFIQALLNPAAYPHPVAKIELIETHISWVLLTGPFAYKIKKNIQFDFLDFSTLEKRHFYCEEELRLNRRLAPELYLQVVPITGSEANPKIGGTGTAFEYAVKMQQFATDQLLSNVADNGLLDDSIIDQLADLTAGFHRHAAADTSESRFGTPEETQHWFAGNFSHIRPLIHDKGFLSKLDQLEQWGELTLQNNTPLMLQRKQQGFIRECHGDLHLGNIALIDGTVTAFDGIEFNPGLHWIDVMSEIAFVVMDLQERGFNKLATRFLNRYLSNSGDYEGLALLPYYLAYRALVRCKVALLRWQQHQNPQDYLEAENYVNLAERYSAPGRRRIIITHGFSGSGKSTYSTEIADAADMVHLRSDVERQRLLAAEKQGKSGVNQGIYSTDKILLIYQHLAGLAASVLAAGYSVLIDAAFLQAAQRDIFLRLAAAQQVDFLIMDFYAPIAELQRRIRHRQQLGQDASEATLEVLAHQLKTAQPLSAEELKNTIKVDTCAKDALETLLASSPFKDLLAAEN